MSTGKFSKGPASVASSDTVTASPAPSPKKKTGVVWAVEQEERQVLYPIVRALTTAIDTSDDVPQIQALSTLNFEISSFFNQVSFSDHTAFQTNLGGMMEHIALIDTLVEQGKGFVYMLYTYRVVSIALPHFVADVQPDDGDKKVDLASVKSELEKVQFDILRNEIAKIKDLIAFVTQASDRFRECLENLVKLTTRSTPMPGVGDNRVDLADTVLDKVVEAGAGGVATHPGSADHVIVPEVVYDSLLKLLDVIIKISEIKDQAFVSGQKRVPKESLVSDIGRYRELKADVRGKRDQGLDFEDELLQGFLDKGVFEGFAAEVRRVEGHEQIFCHMLQYIIDRDTAQPPQYSTPDERFALARCFPHLLLLLDGDKRASCFDAASSAYALARPRNGLKPFQMYCKRYAFVPLIGDLTLHTLSVLERSPNYSPSKNLGQTQKWGNKLKLKFKRTFELQPAWPQIRSDFEVFCTRLTLMTNSLSRTPFLKELGEKNVDLAQEVFGMAHEGAALLASWTGLLQRVMAWKFTHPFDVNELVRRFGAAYKDMAGREYEQVVKHNFTADELSMFADIVSMIKSLYALLASAEPTLAPIIRFHVHHSVQQLVQGDLLPILHRADKHKSGSLPLMLQIRSIGADWIDGTEPRENYKTYRRSHGPVYATHPARVVSPSHTQLTLLRVLVRSLVDEASHARSHKRGVFARSILEKRDVSLLKRFSTESFFFPSMLNLGATLRQCSDLSFLWFREYWIERTRCIQFSIEESLPWILINHVTTGMSCSAMPETFVHMLDIYNDAANHAINELSKQHLYDEIEAEVSVVLEQLLYMHADELCRHYRDSAASVCLDKEFKQQMEEIKDRSSLTVAQRRLSFVLRQRHLQLLGRSINLNFLLSQIVATKFGEDVESALRKFESSDACGLVELQSMLQVLRESHTQLCAAAQLELPAFDDVLNEADEVYAPTIQVGRIGAHLAYSMVQDIFANFAYCSFTQRFVRSSVAVRAEPEYAPAKKHWADQVFGPVCSKAYRAINELSRGYFGRPHIEALLVICGDELPDLINSCCEYAEQKMADLGEITMALTAPGGLQNFEFDVRLPSSTVEVYRVLESELFPLLGIDDLKFEVFQLFRELGNCLCFLKDLSAMMDVKEQFRFAAVAPLLGIVPDTLPSMAAREVSASPLISTLQALVRTAERSKDEFQFSVHKSTVSAVAELGKKAADAALPAALRTTLQKNAFGGEVMAGASSASVFQSALLRLDSAAGKLGLREKWARVLPPSTTKDRDRDRDRDRKKQSKKNEAPAPESKAPSDGPETLHTTSLLNPSRFSHVFSSLCFLFNARNPTLGSDPDDDDPDARRSMMQNELFENTTDLEVFGHGFSFAGCALLHLLDQRTIYELTDYSLEVLRLRKYEESLPRNHQEVLFGNVQQDEMADVNDFVDEVQAQSDFHGLVFALLDAQMPRVRGPEQEMASGGRGAYAPPSVFAD